MATKVKNAVIETLAPTTLTYGNNVFSIKGFKEIAGHDDSIPYQAKIYMNGKCIGTASNDGWGGPTNIYTSNANELERLNQAEKFLNENNFTVDSSYGPLKVDSVEFVADILADNATLAKDLAKAIKKKVVFFNPKTNVMKTFNLALAKGQSVEERLMQSRMLRQDLANKVKSLRGVGFILINDLSNVEGFEPDKKSA